ncbi:transposase [Streptomyces sp. NPDC004237]|uniref:RNA-guided endonuclease InsQ/TnpB family protein n=1 Tax=Streptomyces sp. NPDC004237 TaxID=3154455 RepID=UPI0033A1946B
MEAAAGAGGAGHARYTFRLRVSSTARTALLVEWDRCRWVWNECVAKSRATHQHNKAHPQDQRTCGPAQLDKMLTEARRTTPWLAEGSSVVQQQTVRDFGKSRAKAQMDIKDRLSMHRRAGMPKWRKKKEARATLNYTQRGFRLKDGRLHLASGIVLSVVWSRDLPADPSSARVYQDNAGAWYASFVVPAQAEPLPEASRVIGVDWGVKETATTTSDDHDLPHAEHGKKAHKKLARQREDTGRKWAKKVVTDHDAIAVEDFKPKFLARTTMARKAADAAIGATKKALIEMGRKHGRDIRLVHPAYTTMDCAHCGARAKHALPLGERTYTCTACRAVSPRDKNSARVMLVRAGLNPAGTDGIRPPRAQLAEAA